MEQSSPIQLDPTTVAAIQKERQQKVTDFINEIDKVQARHKLLIIPVLRTTRANIIEASLDVVPMPEPHEPIEKQSQ